MNEKMSDALARRHGMRKFRDAGQKQIIFRIVAGMAVLVLPVMVVRRTRQWF